MLYIHYLKVLMMTLLIGCLTVHVAEAQKKGSKSTKKTTSKKTTSKKKGSKDKKSKSKADPEVSDVKKDNSDFDAPEPKVKIKDADFKTLVRKGDERFEFRDMIRAAAYYKKALSKDQTSFYVAYKLARTQWFAEKPDSALECFKFAYQLDPNGSDTLYFDYGLALKKAGQYDDAEKMLNEFQKRHPDDDYLKKQARFEVDGINIARKLMAEDSKYIINPVPFNTKNNDFSTTIWSVKTDSFFIFTSHRKGTRGKKRYSYTGEPYSDVWVVKMDDDSTFGTPEVLGKKKINTKANDGSAQIDPTGKFMYYTICGKGKVGKKWGCSIYMSEYNEESKAWGKFQLVPGVNGKQKVIVNSRGKTKEVPTDDSQPYLTSDGQTMYFVSNRPGGSGGKDIWYSKKSGTVWGDPVNAGMKINTEFDEIFPTVGKDDNSLYFSSNGHKGLGGFDNWKVEGKEGAYSDPVNLGYPINTSYDDFALYWLVPDSIGYLSSDRTAIPARGRMPEMQGTVGRHDIFRILKRYIPEYKITVHGNVRDKRTKQIVPFATVTLYKIDKNGITPMDTFKTQQDGRYEFPLDHNTDYKLVGNAPEYLASEVFISTKEVDTQKGPVDLEKDIDIYLEGIIIDEPYILQNIYYDFDKSDLRPESIEELDRLAKLLEQNPTIVIQIGSHTDTNGSERYNIRLGDRRARSVVKYLIEEKKFPKERVVAFGYGESQPMIYPELSDQDEQANRRTEFRIRSFNYKPKK